MTIGSLSTTNSGGNDGFVIAFTSAGVASWVVSIASTGPDTASSVALDGNGYVYATGKRQEKALNKIYTCTKSRSIGMMPP